MFIVYVLFQTAFQLFEDDIWKYAVCIQNLQWVGKIYEMKKKTREANEILVTCQLLAHLVIRFTNWINVWLTVVQNHYFCCLYLIFQKELD